MAPGQQSDANHGPPYPSQYQMLGQTPSIVPDVPVNAVFLVLFILGAVGHAWQYRINILHERKFIPNAAAFAFCVTRIFTTILWIVWACNPKSIDCEIASLIFGYVGIILLFIINLIFSRRIVRGQHPHFGWTMLFSIPFTILFLIVVATIICLIVAIVIMFTTRNPGTLQSAVEIQRYGATLYAVIAFLPIIIVGISSLVRCHPKIKATQTVDKFGEGTMRTKIIIVVVTALLLSLGACYRAGAILAPAVSIHAPEAGYLSKACFYIFTFTIEFTVVAFLLVMRIDRRFYVPDGAWGPHSYAGGFVFAGEPGSEKTRTVGNESQRQFTGSSTELYKSWFGGLKSPQVSSSDSSRISRPTLQSHEQSSATQPTQPQRVTRNSSRGSRISHKTTGSADISRTSRRNSFSASRASLRELRHQRSIVREQSMSWGGVTREGVCDTLGESREIIPYPGFEQAHVEDQVAADVGVEGAAKEMGFDPKTGKWALRSVSHTSTSASRRTSELPSPTLPFSPFLSSGSRSSMKGSNTGS